MMLLQTYKDVGMAWWRFMKDLRLFLISSVVELPRQ
jgi:hypothetical protein